MDMHTALILRANGQLDDEMNSWVDEKFAEYDAARDDYRAHYLDQDPTARDAAATRIQAVKDEVSNMLRLKYSRAYA